MVIVWLKNLNWEFLKYWLVQAMYVGFSRNVTDGIYVAKDCFIINIHHIYKQVDILISKNQAL